MCSASSGVTGGTGTDSSLRPNKGHVKSASVSSSGPDSGAADPLRPRYEENNFPLHELYIFVVVVVFVFVLVSVIYGFGQKYNNTTKFIKRNLLVSRSTAVRVHRRQQQEHQLFHVIHRQEVRSIRDRQDLEQLMHKVHQGIHRMLPDPRSSQSSVRSFPRGK